MAERQRGVQVHRPIIYGSHARLLTETERSLATPGHTHRWTVFLASATSPQPKAGEEDDILPGGQDDLTYLIKKVTFKLHETYPNPSRVLEKPPYRVSETGWGEFTIQIRIQFVNEAGEKPINFQHGLKLHHWGPPIEPPPVTAEDGTQAGPSTANTPAPAEGSSAAQLPPSSSQPPENKEKDGEGEGDGDADADGDEDGDGQVKDEISTPQQDVAVDDGEVKPESMEQGSQPPDSHLTRGRSHAQAIAEQRISAAAKWPVLAWQYDELVFSDPPLAFYNLLNENPPTRLPAKTRRARDQREEHENKKAKTNAVASSSRQATAAPDAPAEGDKAGEGDAAPVTADGTPAPGTKIVGIPGEAGSADVPLEFSSEMEKGEWNKLHMARRKIIDEMDKWRSKLIEHEKELARVKEEMASAG